MGGVSAGGRPMIEHQHIAYGGKTSPIACVDLGHGVCIREYPHESRPVQRFIIAHERTVSFDPALHVETRCAGTIPVAGDHAWGMTGSLATGDLTLSPSVLCIDPDHLCGGSHGWVRDGKWVPA